MIPGRRALRLSIAVVVIATVTGLPALAAQRPGPADPPVSSATLLQRIIASSAESYAGYAQSYGGIGIPDVSELGTLPALLGDTQSLRVWWASGAQWRVDQVSATGEDDTYVFPGGSWEWDYEQQTATELTGSGAVRLPRAGDLTPDQLGRRLAALGTAAGVSAVRIGARRIAGRTALGLELTSRTGADATTIASVDIWADESTGVPLAVTITARGLSRPTLSTTFLSFSPHAPAARTVRFSPPAGAQVEHVTTAQVQGLLSRLHPLSAPQTVDGLSATDRIGVQPGIATYGQGLSQIAVISLSDSDGDQLARDLIAARASVTYADHARLVTLSTALLNLTLRSSRFSDLLVVGTVPTTTLDAVEAALRPARPPTFPSGPMPGPVSQ